MERQHNLEPHIAWIRRNVPGLRKDNPEMTEDRFTALMLCRIEIDSLKINGEFLEIEEIAALADVIQKVLCQSGEQLCIILSPDVIAQVIQ